MKKWKSDEIIHIVTNVLSVKYYMMGKFKIITIYTHY